MKYLVQIETITEIGHPNPIKNSLIDIAVVEIKEDETAIQYKQIFFDAMKECEKLVLQNYKEWIKSDKILIFVQSKIISIFKI